MARQRKKKEEEEAQIEEAAPTEEMAYDDGQGRQEEESSHHPLSILQVRLFSFICFKHALFMRRRAIRPEKLSNTAWCTRLVFAKQDAGILTGPEIRKFQEAGYCTCEALAMTTKRELLTVKGIGETKADRVLAEGTNRSPCHSSCISVANPEWI